MRAVFFDRDNTLTVDKGYCYKVSDFRWMDGADKALAYLHHLGVPVFIVTNQGGIAKGLFTQQDMQAFNNHLCQQANLAGGHITDIAFCPHHPQALDPALRDCHCRKPATGLFHALASKHHIDLSASIMIGDRDSDIEAGIAAGMDSYLYNPTTNLETLVKTIIATHFTKEQLAKGRLS